MSHHETLLRARALALALLLGLGLGLGFGLGPSVCEGDAERRRGISLDRACE